MKHYQKPQAEIVEIMIDEDIMATGASGTVIDDNGQVLE